MWWIILSTSVLGLVVIYALGLPKRRAQVLLEKLPGVKSSSLVKAALKAVDRHVHMHRWSEEYGKLFQMNIRGQDYVVVSDPQLANQVMGSKETDLPKFRNFYKTLDQIIHWRAWPTTTTIPARDVYWQAARQCLLRAFHRTQLKQDFDIIRTKAVVLIEILASLGPGQVVDMHDACCRLTLDVLGLSKLDFDFEAVESEDEVLVLKLVQECFAEWNLRLANPWHRHMGWFTETAAKGQQKYLMFQELLDALWTEIDSRGPPPEENYTVAAQLVRLRDNVRSSRPFPPMRAYTDLGAVLLQGWEASGAALSWCLYCLARHPQAQDKLVAELKREGISAIGEKLEYQTLGKLPYLEAVVREVLRLYPPSAIGSLRQAVKDLKLGDQAVPKGTAIWVHIYSIQRSSRLWLQPNDFIPERWLGDSGVVVGASSSGYDGWVTVDPNEGGPQPLRGEEGDKGAQEGGKSQAKKGLGAKEGGEEEGPKFCNPAAYMPFGMGPRTCPAQSLVRTSLMTALALMVSALKFETVDDDSAYIECQHLTLVPGDGMPLIITPRPEYQEVLQAMKEAAEAVEALTEQEMMEKEILEAAVAKAVAGSSGAGGGMAGPSTAEVAGRVRPAPNKGKARMV